MRGVEAFGDITAQPGQRGEQLREMTLLRSGAPGPGRDQNLKGGNRCRAQKRIGDRVADHVGRHWEEDHQPVGARRLIQGVRQEMRRGGDE